LHPMYPALRLERFVLRAIMGISHAAAFSVLISGQTRPRAGHLGHNQCSHAPRKTDSSILGSCPLADLGRKLLLGLPSQSRLPLISHHAVQFYSLCCEAQGPVLRPGPAERNVRSLAARRGGHGGRPRWALRLAPGVARLRLTRRARREKQSEGPTACIVSPSSSARRRAL